MGTVNFYKNDYIETSICLFDEFEINDIIDSIVNNIKIKINKLDKYLIKYYGITLFGYDDIFTVCKEYGYYEGCQILINSIFDDFKIDKLEDWYLEEFFTDEYECNRDEFKKTMKFCNGYLEYLLLKIGYENNFEKVIGRSWTQTTDVIELNEILEIEKEYPIFKELYEK